MSSEIEALKAMVLRYAGVDTTPTQKNKKEIVEDDQGRKGFWTTSKGRHIFIPVNGATQSNKSVTVKGKDIPDDKRFKTTEKEEKQERGMSVESKPAKTAELRWKIQKKPKEKPEPKPEGKQDLSQYQRPMTEFDSYVARRVANNCYHGIADAMEKFVESGMNKELSRKASRNLGALAARVYRLHGGREALNTFARGLGVHLEGIEDDQKALNHLISTVRMNIENNHSRSNGLKRRYEINLQMFDNLQAKLEGRVHKAGIAQPVADSQTEQKQPEQKEKEDERIEQEEREKVRGRSDSDTGTSDGIQKTLFDVGETEKEKSEDKPDRRNKPSDGGRSRRRTSPLDNYLQRMKEMPLFAESEKEEEEQEETKEEQKPFGTFGGGGGFNKRKTPEEQKEMERQRRERRLQQLKDIRQAHRGGDYAIESSISGSRSPLEMSMDIDRHVRRMEKLFSAPSESEEVRQSVDTPEYRDYLAARLEEMAGNLNAMVDYKNKLMSRLRRQQETADLQQAKIARQQRERLEELNQQTKERQRPKTETELRDRRERMSNIPGAYQHIDSLKLSPVIKEEAKRRIDDVHDLITPLSKDIEADKMLKTNISDQLSERSNNLKKLESAVKSLSESDILQDIQNRGTRPGILTQKVFGGSEPSQEKTKPEEPKRPRQNAEIQDWFKRLDSIVANNPDDKKIKSLAKEAEAFRTTDISVEDLKEMLPGKKKLLKKLDLKKSGTIEAIA